MRVPWVGREEDRVRKPEVGQVWRVSDGGGLWMNVVLVDYKKNLTGGSWVARTLSTWRKWWLSEERWNPEAPQSRLTGFCSLDPEFYSPYLPDTVGSTNMKKKRHSPPPVPREPPPVDVVLKQLKAKIGRYALQRLRLGKATFRVWRGSTPHNHWVEGTARMSYLWHSDDDDRGPSLWPAFQLLEESKDRIAHHWVHGDGGQPYLSVYVLKPEYRL